MNFRELLQSYEGLLEWKCIFHLNNRDMVVGDCDEDSKTCITVHECYVMVEHLKLDDKGELHPMNINHIQLSSINSFEIILEQEEG